MLSVSTPACSRNRAKKRIRIPTAIATISIYSCADFEDRQREGEQRAYPATTAREPIRLGRVGFADCKYVDFLAGVQGSLDRGAGALRAPIPERNQHMA